MFLDIADLQLSLQEHALGLVLLGLFHQFLVPGLQLEQRQVQSSDFFLRLQNHLVQLKRHFGTHGVTNWHHLV